MERTTLSLSLFLFSSAQENTIFIIFIIFILHVYTMCSARVTWTFLVLPLPQIWKAPSRILEVGYVVLTRPVTDTTTMAELQ